MKTKFWLAIVMALCLGITPVAHAKAVKTAKTANKAPAPVNTAEQDKNDIERIEKYLNEITSIKADFTQISDNGEYRHGAISILRPGKMRVTYDAPSKDFIVADGSFINIWDGEMQQQSSIPIDSNLGDIILRDNIKLSGDTTVTDIARAPAKIEITIVSSKDPGAGKLTLIFEDRPLKLRQWRVLDPQGRTTGVSLENAQEGVEFPSGTFHFVSPNFGNGKHSKMK
ncbi:MAG: outer membrane lipoprotein carrier protein LolA [Alphaproteobacteria bacterium]|nr:outer membrane lipoprotein carrier protein LolA [Alphaproteobacteria bacterium]